MLTAAPGQTVTVTQSGIPTGRSVGITVQKAANDTIAIGRSTTTVVERPAGSGNYVGTFVAPVEPDLYLIILDWNSGHPTPTTSIVEELQITSAADLVDTGLGEIADRLKVAIGSQSFMALLNDPTFGSAGISLAIETVKARVMQSPPSTANEATLPSVVLSYLAKLSGLELMSAIRGYWASQPQSVASGNDPTETVNFPNRLEVLRALEADLLRQVYDEQGLAISLLPDPILSPMTGPAIDECDDMHHVTRDPRRFPREHTFPYHQGDLIGRRW